ncbi:MAG: hypothetical protein R3190_06195, partial [Thermoanaerobaculia bacterium]|nr:hypothetical protein [Thermoanaerobaculia bacterium]
MEAYGWNARVAERYRRHDRPGVEPGRVAMQLRGVYRLWSRDGACEAVAKRSLGRRGPGFPVVGDWVAFAPPAPGSERGQIRAVGGRAAARAGAAGGGGAPAQAGGGHRHPPVRRAR